MKQFNMLLFWTSVLLAIAAAHKVVESTEDIDPETAESLNTTTLYPVQSRANNTDAAKQKTATSWKIETTFGESNADSNGTDSKEWLVLESQANSSQEFKPSQHLGNFLDEGSFEGPTRATPDAFPGVIKKPPTGFISSLKDSKIPQEQFKHYLPVPYKIETPIITKAKDGWRPTAGSSHSSSLESKPTDEAPVRLPAGGLYKLPDPFKVRPGTTDEDFGLEFSSDAKEHPIKKRMHPMTKLMQLIVSLIPVGIIFAALTPNVISIEPDSSLPPNIFRRADGSLASVPPISERCRRRLLCELHSETNYSQRDNSSRRGKQCHRIRCEDPEALTRTLQWLLSHVPTSEHTHEDKLGPNVHRPINKPNGYHKSRRPAMDNYNTNYGSKLVHDKYSPTVGDDGDRFNGDFT